MYCRLVAGFGAGIAYSAVRHDPPDFLIASGVIFALLEAGLFKVIIVFLPSGYVDNMLSKRVIIDKLDYEKCFLMETFVNRPIW